MVSFVRPIREKAESIYSDQSYLNKIIAMGTEKARASASKTIQEAREKVGLIY
jgi:tryptophanyl-tRNA synthetase